MVKETKLYDILQISTEAGDQEIRKAYKTLALKYHPDKQIFASAEEKEKTANIFKSISYAYSILSDPNKRRLYDNYGEEVAKNPELQTQVFSADNHHYDHMNSQNYPDSNDGNFYSAFPAQDHSFQTASNLFNQFFNDVNTGGLFDGMNFPGNHNGIPPYNNNRNFHNNSHRSHSSKAKFRKGRDIHDNIYCSLLDYYKGEEFKLSLTRRIKCPKCKARDGLKIYTCNDCCGSGVIISEIRSGLMYQRSESTCSRCNGTGEFIPSKFICDECGGNKLIDTKIILKFKTPRGVSDGYRIVFPNAADEGIDLIPGDVIITLRDDKQNDNTKFKRFGNNLLTTIPIPLATVLCGGYLIFEHINGDKLKIHIARGDIKSSNQLKIVKGYGMPIHTQASASSTNKHKKKKFKSKEGKKNNNKNDSNETSENLDFHTVIDNTEVQGNDPMVVTSTDTSSGDDSFKYDYGDLYIRFEIQLPDAKDFSNQQLNLLGAVFGISSLKNFDKVSSLSATSSTSSSSDDDITSLKMSTNYETSSSSISKAYKSSESNGSDESIDIAKGKKKQVDDYVKQAILEGKNVDSSNLSRNEVPTNETSSSGDSSDSNEANVDEEGNKLVYLQDLTDVNKIGLSLLDFPDAFNEKTTDTKNGDISASAEDKNKTAEVMDNSFADFKPRQKKAKNRRFV
ncbi:hypothetical protein CANINC_002343 [Pichia inconspicua]|uniref:J domain-containing protein n=1 Tax=Pichia inconspicua TaxID=52247 RepID=A0A4T0X1F0_9ASCO|nr:hypothetical protein CANINC_002343 [[Candida] inconspicua]